MAPHTGRTPAAVASPPTPDEPTLPKGPNPGHISIANQYTLEQKLRQMLKDNGCDAAREDTYRIQGVQLIDNVRAALQLPVRTFDTAANYYHKFRLSFRDAEYNYQDAALSSLFVACKVEDTIKKSKEILCAAHNIKYPDHQLAQDDKTFEHPSKIIIGLERLILETIGFDFRARYPQKLLVKAIRRLLSAGEEEGFLQVAYDMCIDIYKTFAPIKQTTFTMVMAIIELTALMTERNVYKIKELNPDKWNTNRGCVVETMLDLLDLYAQFGKSTKIGGQFPLDKFIDVKIKINKEVEDRAGLSRFQTWCEKCEAEEKDVQPITPGSATSPATTGSYPSSGTMKRSGGGPGGSTIRFVFDADQARRETSIVNEHFKEEFEEYEVQVEEPIPESEHHRPGRNHPRHNNSHNNNHNNHNERGWAPYHRNRHGHHDRPKGRKGGHGGYY